MLLCHVALNGIDHHRRVTHVGGVTNGSLVWLAGGKAARHLVWLLAAEWQLLKVQRSVASQDHERQVSAAAVIGLGNLTDSTQP